METDGFSGSDLREMCRDAALLCVRDFVHTQSDRYQSVCPCTQQIHQYSFSSPVLHLSVSQSAGWNSPAHQSIGSSKIDHEVEEVKVGGWSWCSAACCSGLSVGHMTTSSLLVGQPVSQPPVKLHGCGWKCGHVSPMSSVLAGVINIMTRIHFDLRSPSSCWQPLGSAHMVPGPWQEIFLFFTLLHLTVKWCMNLQHNTRQEVTWKQMSLNQTQ